MKSFFAGGDFVGLATRESIEVATVDYVAENEVGGNDGDVGSDIGGDGPNTRFERVFVVNINIAIPRSEPEKIFTA